MVESVTVRRYPPELVRYLQGGGRSKVLFGTNYPMIAPERALEGIDDLELDDEARELFLSGNARRVFGLLEAGRQKTVRSWHVYYLQNSRSNDVAYVLQQAFTPGHITAFPTPTGGLARGGGRQSGGSMGNSGGGMNSADKL